MKDKELYQRIEEFDEYPPEYQSNLKTQQKLIEESVNSSKTKMVATSVKFRRKIMKSIIAATLIISTFYISIISIKTEQIKNTQVKRIQQRQTLNTPKNNIRLIVPKTHISPKTENMFDTLSAVLDTPQAMVYIAKIVNIDADTNVPQKATATQEQPKLFAKRQRFKQFDFEAKVNTNTAVKVQKKLEFFVLKDGQFKLLSRNKNQINIHQFQ